MANVACIYGSSGGIWHGEALTCSRELSHFVSRCLFWHVLTRPLLCSIERVPNQHSGWHVEDRDTIDACMFLQHFPIGCECKCQSSMHRFSKLASGYISCGHSLVMFRDHSRIWEIQRSTGNCKLFVVVAKVVNRFSYSSTLGRKWDMGLHVYPNTFTFGQTRGDMVVSHLKTRCLWIIRQQNDTIANCNVIHGNVANGNVSNGKVANGKLGGVHSPCVVARRCSQQIRLLTIWCLAIRWLTRWGLTTND